MKVSPRITDVSTNIINSIYDLPTEMPILFGDYLYWIHSGSDYINYCYYGTSSKTILFEKQYCFYNSYAPTVAVDNTISR